MRPFPSTAVLLLVAATPAAARAQRQSCELNSDCGPGGRCVEWTCVPPAPAANESPVPNESMPAGPQAAETPAPQQTDQTPAANPSTGPGGQARRPSEYCSLNAHCPPDGRCVDGACRYPEEPVSSGDSSGETTTASPGPAAGRSTRDDGEDGVDAGGASDEVTIALLAGGGYGVGYVSAGAGPAATVIGFTHSAMANALVGASYWQGTGDDAHAMTFGYQFVLMGDSTGLLHQHEFSVGWRGDLFTARGGIGGAVLSPFLDGVPTVGGLATTSTVGIGFGIGGHGRITFELPVTVDFLFPGGGAYVTVFFAALQLALSYG
ncbi:MAG: hypothetical protein JXB32_23460 [Deltaproteobacteria bacterium]|nr:hypothetical protein [Deltaproteobacteria bacterium]